MAPSREFDLVLLGPTGYTGKLCGEYIVQHTPTNLKWALAGRSASKLQSVSEVLESMNPDRIKPDIISVQLNDEELDILARRTRIVLNCVGPYHLYSTPVVAACAANGTHHLDVTGETPWIKLIIEKYHDTAKANGALIIPSLGLESVPPDLLAWSLVKLIREKLSVGTKEVTTSLHEMRSAGPSGGTLSTILTMIETVKISDLIKSMNPLALAVPPLPEIAQKQSFAEKIFGVRSIPDLGTLTTSISSLADTAIVYRSSTLLRDFYGPRFHFRHFKHARNAVVGAAFHYAFMFGITLLTFAPVRWLASKLAYAPGEGPKKEDSLKDMAEYRAVAVADQEDIDKPKRAFGRLVYHGSMYGFTGLMLTEAAMMILEHEDEVRQTSGGGGIVTSATLGQYYVDRLERVGCHLETELLDD